MNQRNVIVEFIDPIHPAKTCLWTSLVDLAFSQKKIQNSYTYGCMVHSGLEPKTAMSLSRTSRTRPVQASYRLRGQIDSVHRRLNTRDN